GKGNEGVTGLVKQTPGSLGYVELAYANQNKLATAALRNREGVYVKPTLKSTTAAAAGVEVPDDFRVSITDASGREAYPISGFTYLLVRKDQKDAAKGGALIHFLWWAVQDGQTAAPSLDYAPLPSPVAKKVKAKLETLTVQGKRVRVAAG